MPLTNSFPCQLLRLVGSKARHEELATFFSLLYYTFTLVAKTTFCFSISILAKHSTSRRSSLHGPEGMGLISCLQEALLLHFHPAFQSKRYQIPAMDDQNFLA